MNDEQIDDQLRKELHDRAWAYFDRHAEQRLKTVNFYLILCVAIAAGFVSVVSSSNIFNGWPFGIVLAVVSFIFWKLEDRNRELVKHSESVLKQLEDLLPSNVPISLRLFGSEEQKSEERKSDRSIITGRYSYTTCFRLLFGILGIGGFVAGVALFSIAIYRLCGR